MVLLDQILGVLFYGVFVKVVLGKLNSIYRYFLRFFIMSTQPINPLKKIREVVFDRDVMNPWLPLIVEILVLWSVLEENDEAAETHPLNPLPRCCLGFQNKLVFVFKMLFKWNSTAAVKALSFFQMQL